MQSHLLLTSLLQSPPPPLNAQPITPINALTLAPLIPLSQAEELAEAEKIALQKRSAASFGSEKQDLEEHHDPLNFDMKMIFLIYRHITAKFLSGFITGKVCFKVSSGAMARPLVRAKLVVQPKARRTPAIKDMVIYILLNRNKVYSLQKNKGS